MQDPANEAELRAERLDQVVELLRSKVAAPQQATLEAFVRQYFGQVDPEDLAERDARRSVRRGAVALELRAPARRRAGCACGSSTRRIAEHGWQSTHTIVEIVNDDMPFLVDSVTMEVNRHGLTLHLIVHPIVTVRARRRRHARRRWRPTARARRRARIVDPCRGRPRRRAGAARGAGRRHRRACSATCARRSPTGRRCRQRVLDDRRRPRREAAADRRPRSSPRAGPSCAGWPTTTSPSSATARTTSSCADGEDALRIVPGSSLGILREVRTASPGKSSRSGFAALPPRSARLRARDPSCWWSPSRPRARPCTGRATSTTSPSSASTPTARSAASTASSACSRRPPTARSPAEIPLLRRKVARRRRARRPRARQPRRQVARQHPRDLPARRAVPDRRRRAAAHRDRHPAPRRAAALPPVRAPRPVRALPRRA